MMMIITLLWDDGGEMQYMYKCHCLIYTTLNVWQPSSCVCVFTTCMPDLNHTQHLQNINEMMTTKKMLLRKITLGKCGSILCAVTLKSLPHSCSMKRKGCH